VEEEEEVEDEGEVVERLDPKEKQEKKRYGVNRKERTRKKRDRGKADSGKRTLFVLFASHQTTYRHVVSIGRFMLLVQGERDTEAVLGPRLGETEKKRARRGLTLPEQLK